MNTIVELLMAGGGLAGASPRQIRAVLDKLSTIAVVVPHGSLPQAHFGVTDSQPYVAFLAAEGGPNSTAPFAREQLSASRAMRVVREAMAVHASLTSDVPHHRAAYSAARQQYLRNRVEAESVSTGGAQALATGAL